MLAGDANSASASWYLCLFGSTAEQALCLKSDVASHCPFHRCLTLLLVVSTLIWFRLGSVSPFAVPCTAHCHIIVVSNWGNHLYFTRFLDVSRVSSSMHQLQDDT